MLTEGQKNYLMKLSPERADSIIKIKPFNSSLAFIANRIIEKIKKEVSTADPRFMGASALGISGQNDIDIYVICSQDLKEGYVLKLGKIFGEQTKSKWHWFEEGQEVSVYLSDPEDDKFKEQLEIFKIFKNNQQILKDYENLKTSMNGKTYREYQIAKYEFYNQVLGIN